MQKNYYAIIPANVRYDKDLTPNSKLLYGEITALCNEKGYCWASNQYFAELYGVSKKSVSTWISDLIEGGYIKSEIQYKEGTKEIFHRYLRIVHYPMEEKVNTPMEEKVKDNNTSFNTTSNNTKEYIYSNEFEQFWSIYPRKVDKKKAYKSFKTAVKNHSLEIILDGTQKYTKQVQNTDTKFIKHPTTFLNNDSFIDGYEEGAENAKDRDAQEIAEQYNLPF
ncbi:helix-turn-helix domain-containing protein [Bacillus sp. FJAT-49736]|uniref:helix-turn-helix domain-containing protein n=1 Tax=Bacillus sp. FJAT-49736 TaxID=2833582 RepID=UPI002015EAA1|nr:helix-turn-helix domain-containing protein [Bacillus sp. FJAT-49736]